MITLKNHRKYILNKYVITLNRKYINVDKKKTFPIYLSHASGVYIKVKTVYECIQPTLPSLFDK